MNAFDLQRDAFGRWTLVLADGTRHTPVTAIRAYPVTDPEGGVALMDAEGHELLWIDALAQLAPAVRSKVPVEPVRRSTAAHALRRPSGPRHLPGL